MLDGLRQQWPPRRTVIYGAVAWFGGLCSILVILALASGSTETLVNFPLVFSTYYWGALHGWAGILSGQVGLLVLAGMPASLLFAVGYYAARRSADRPESGARRGAWIAAGYLPVATVCFVWLYFRLNTFFDSVAAETAVALNPFSLLLPLVFTGLVFPVAFGGLGGYVADRRATA